MKSELLTTNHGQLPIRTLIYIITRRGIQNIWAQPADGGQAKQLTDFKDQRIFNFAWSRDGKQIALSRDSQMDDVILLRDSQ